MQNPQTEQKTKSTRARFRRAPKPVNSANSANELTKYRLCATLVTISPYEKLIFKVAHPATEAVLTRIDESFEHLQSKNRKPVWLSDDDTMYVKMGVPRFMSKKLWELDALIGKEVVVPCTVREYQSEKFGAGYYYQLAGAPQLVRRPTPNSSVTDC